MPHARARCRRAVTDGAATSRRFSCKTTTNGIQQSEALASQPTDSVTERPHEPCLARGIGSMRTGED
eukprot:6202376-Pleurochrysis_carterae.AAC.1